MTGAAEHDRPTLALESLMDDLLELGRCIDLLRKERDEWKARALDAEADLNALQDANVERLTME